MRFMKSALSIITMRLQPEQRILMSAPTRITVHLSLPQGCVLRICTRSPSISSSIASTLASNTFLYIIAGAAAFFKRLPRASSARVVMT